MKERPEKHIWIEGKPNGDTIFHYTDGKYGEKQTQEELTERLLFYESGDSKFCPNPNLRENFKNRGAFWRHQKRSIK